ncbi:MAG: Tetracycline resistance protein, class C [Bryobacteraceae bacterium]|nr:Tetracycline resistance protein, class C [Bryobacteraceae bacterium]
MNPPASRKALTFLFLTVFLDLLGAGILLPIIPYLVRQFRSDATTIGLLSLSFSAAQFAAAPILGVLSDRYGRRPVLLLSILGSALGYFLFGLAGSLAVMYFSRILDGFTGGNISTAQAYIADVTLPEDRAKNFGLIGAAFGLGFIFGPAIGGALSHISVNAPAYGAGVLSLGTACFGYFALPESLSRHQRQPHGFRLADLDPVRPLGELLRRPELRLLLAALFLINFAMSGLQSNFSVFTMVRFRYSPEQTAMVFVYIGVLAALVQGYLVRRLNPVLGERRMAILGTFMLSAGFLGIAFSYNVWQLLIAIAGVAGIGFATTAQTAILSRRVSAREQGWLLGSTQSVLSLTRVAGPIYAGAMFDLLGSGAPYWTGAIVVCGALALTVLGASE